eukprot:gene8005-biopygen8178
MLKRLAVVYDSSARRGLQHQESINLHLKRLRPLLLPPPPPLQLRTQPPQLTELHAELSVLGELFTLRCG